MRFGSRPEFTRPWWNGPRKLATGHLKCCPLCDAVNATANGECFVCGWHGAFDHDSEHVEQGVMELIERCPELVDAMTVRPKLKGWRLWVSKAQRMFARRVDLRI